MKLTQHIDQIFEINSDKEFSEIALEVFQFQYENVPVYRQYCDSLGRNEPQSIIDIPFLPIDFFKTHEVRSFQREIEQQFKSSGTTKSIRSNHFIEDLSLYEKSFDLSYRKFIGNPEEQIIIALLPNYVEQKYSSLVYMVDHLIKQSKHQLSDFYLYDPQKIIDIYHESIRQNRQPVLFGVTYALLDLAKKDYEFPGLKVIETGGMKGRREEISKEQLHHILKDRMKLKDIYSEYGMCELLSQSYSKGLNFHSPSWMRILVRDKNDPFAYVTEGKQGGINVIDLANLYSCSFIQTQDLGRSFGEYFQINGRLDQSELRGCNLMVDDLIG